MGQGVGYLAGVGFARIAHFLAGGLHGQEHVGARVAIRHWEDVERIDELLIDAQPCQTGLGQMTQEVTVDGFRFGRRAARRPV